MTESRATTPRRLFFYASFFLPAVLVLSITAFVAGFGLGAFLVYSDKLPEIPELKRYQPRTVSTFYADDGSVIGVFYKEKRFVVDLQSIPSLVVNAFIAAEDARFFQHTGIDPFGIARALYRNVLAGRIHQGASTITQQVTRNLLLTQEKKISRKIKEIILARRVEKLWGKKKILYIYLNEVYLGDGCHGVEAAARNYFDKHTAQLTVAEAALLAAIVSNPRKYNPFNNNMVTLKKQRKVLKNMLELGFISRDEYEKARGQRIRLRKDTPKPFDIVPDFTEAVRRYIIRRYGEARLYNEGLRVFTTCSLKQQQEAWKAIQRGVKEITRRQKNLAFIRTVARGQFSEFLKNQGSPILTKGGHYRGLVTRVERSGRGTELHVSLSLNLKAKVNLEKHTGGYKVGQVVALRFMGGRAKSPAFALDDHPSLQAALVCVENSTGYVKAIVGGSSRTHFGFNRATQAQRQPGSSFKPIMYAVALEQFGYSPATVIVDEPVVIQLAEVSEEWSPNNAGEDFLGPVSLRRALELSRNICAIKILMDVGFDPVISMARRMGITANLKRNLSLCLGTSELNLFELTSAYTVFPNLGAYLKPVLVKRVEDRYGNILEDNTRIVRLAPSQMPRPVNRKHVKGSRAQTANRLGVMMRKGTQMECPSPDDPVHPLTPGAIHQNDRGAGKATEEQSRAVPGTCPPAPPRRETAAMSPQTAYIMTSLLQGVVRSGTAAKMKRYVKRSDVCGKTGTTNNATDAWFVGYSPSFTTGVWVGFDDGRPLGPKETGARAALPIWASFMNQLLTDVPPAKFAVPKGIIREEMITFTGNVRKGFGLGIVIEPVYAELAGQTLVASPLDPEETFFPRFAAPPQATPQSQPPEGTPVGALYKPDGPGGVPLWSHHPTLPPKPAFRPSTSPLLPQTAGPSHGAQSSGRR